MIGDVNLFLQGVPPAMREVTESPLNSKSEDEVEEEDFSAEAEIMIAGTHLFVRCRVSSPHGCSISF